jgi:hypothetical protein
LGKESHPAIHHDVERPIADLGCHQRHHVAVVGYQVASVLKDGQHPGLEPALVQPLPHRPADRTGDDPHYRVSVTF